MNVALFPDVFKRSAARAGEPVSGSVDDACQLIS